MAQNRSRNHCLPPPSPYPWLVYSHGKRMKNQTFYSLSDTQKKIHVRSIPELRNKTVWTSCHDWLLMSQEADTRFHLWNPTTLESIQLPPLHLKPKQYIQDCLLTSPPEDLDSTILLFLYNPSSIIFCCVCDKKWINRGYDEEIMVIGQYDDGDHLVRPVTCNKQIYATTFTKRRMVLIEIIKPRRLVIRPLNCTLPSVPSLGCRVNSYMVESCGQIFFIQIRYGGDHDEGITAVGVFRLDFSTLTWNKVESCPGRAFFLSNDRMISCPAIESDQTGNQIHFTQDEDNRLYSYNIENKSISVSLPCPQIPTPWQTPIWVMVDTRLYDTPAKTKNYAHEEEQDVQKDIELGGKSLDQCTEVDSRAANLNFLDLPEHIVEKIATHLTLFDCMNFRSVNRECRLVAPPKNWRTTSMILENNILNPWLMFSGKDKHIRSLVDPRLGGKYYITIPKFVEDAVVCYSKYGWLLMWKGESFMLFNPLTKSIICLPDIPTLCESYSFSSLPDSFDCLVVGIAFDIQQMFITRPGRTEWIMFEMDEQISFRLSHLTYSVLFKGAFYFLGENGDLAALTFDQEGNPSIEILHVKMPCMSFEENFLVECGEQLLSVFVGKMGKWVRVFEFNRPALTWEEVGCLGNNSLYLCGSSSFAAEANTPEIKNNIYFPRFYGESIIFYSLTERKFYPSGRSETLMNYCGTRKQLQCSWIQPRW